RAAASAASSSSERPTTWTARVAESRSNAASVMRERAEMRRCQRPLERALTLYWTPREFNETGAALAQRNLGLGHASQEPCHQGAEMRLVADDGNQLGVVLVINPGQERLEGAVR